MSAAFDYCAECVAITVVEAEFGATEQTVGTFALPEDLSELTLSYELWSESAGATVHRVGRSRTNALAQFCMCIPAMTNAFCLSVRIEVAVKQCCSACCTESRSGNSVKECVGLKCCKYPNNRSVPSECCFGSLGQGRQRRTARCFTRRFKGTLVLGPSP